ncbi:putative epoxide hydrolase [Phaeomoniella chlamydospora]|uniref:Putative epoxide hydrolase n=1 Tax=Phaeomoniella chlamydospora TaxID=158046 RepID=A0A0G2EH07_PHACM|nr:putative epoxide hydrolase [Phaeomoniella chlamydospora]
MDFSNLPAGSSDSIKPFEINIQPKVLNDLKDSIKLSAFAPLTYESSTADPKDLESFGISYEWLQKARDAWLTYDWKKSESYINTFPHFKASIRHNVADFDVHFVGLFSERKNAIPIVYLHGWPVNAFPIQVQPEGAPEIASVPLNEQRGFARAKHFVSQGWAYGIEHGTRPATIGFVLQSSPIALLSWIGEKFIAWTDETPQVDTILESVTLYWITHTISRCLYPYREKYDPKDLSSPKPLGLSQFHKEIGLVPESWARTRANVVFYRWHDEGGHFAALEKPELLLKDVEDFVSGLKDSGVLV